MKDPPFIENAIKIVAITECYSGVRKQVSALQIIVSLKKLRNSSL